MRHFTKRSHKSGHNDYYYRAVSNDRILRAYAYKMSANSEKQNPFPRDDHFIFSKRRHFFGSFEKALTLIQMLVG